MTHAARRVANAKTVVVRLDRECDISTRAELSVALQAARTGRHAILDLSDVTYIDSTAIDEIVRLHRALAANGGRVALVVTTQPLLRVLSIAGLTRLAEVFADVAAARSALEARSV